MTAAHPKSPPTTRDSGCGTRFSSVSVEVTATTSESKLRKVTAVTVVQRFYRERLSQTRKGYNIRLTILGIVEKGAEFCRWTSTTMDVRTIDHIIILWRTLYMLGTVQLLLFLVMQIYGVVFLSIFIKITIRFEKWLVETYQYLIFNWLVDDN